MAARKKSERRRAPRARAAIPLEIRKERGVIKGRTRDISSTGAYCTLPLFVPLNTELSVSLVLPGDKKKPKRVNCHGIVVRNEPVEGGGRAGGYGMAICFTGIDSRTRREIADYVAKNLPESERRKAAAGEAVGSYDPGRIFVSGARGEGGVFISSANFRVSGDSLDISKNGICFRTDRRIPLFREIAINLVLPAAAGRRGGPAKGTVQCSAVVVGCEKDPESERYDLAAYFIGLTKEQKERLEECIRKAR